MKAGINRRLLEQKAKLKAEQKKNAKVQKELDKHELKAKVEGGGADNVLAPNYVWDENINVYKELESDRPPSSIYKAVGYNDLARVKLIMDGDDAEKRSGTMRKTGKKSGMAKMRLTTGAANREKLEEDVARAEELERKLEITNLHYRKFYDDELENDKDLFPSMPFLSIPIKRGQSRGLKKSWFSFSADKVDESGQVSDEK